jgi:hypothetical protein
MQFSKLVGKLVLCAAAMGTLATAPMVRADPVNTLHTIGFAAGSQTFGISGLGNVYTGGFHGTWNSQDITFWCIELEQHFYFGQNYTEYESSEAGPSDAVMIQLGQLFTEAFKESLNDAEHSAAFQLAIWEIIRDGGGTPDLFAGTFSISNTFGHTGTVTLAQTWLANLGQPSDKYDLFLLRSRSHQDFVTFGFPLQRADVPEPAPFALIAIGWMAMGAVRRVRRRPLAS